MLQCICLIYILDCKIGLTSLESLYKEQYNSMLKNLLNNFLWFPIFKFQTFRFQIDSPSFGRGNICTTYQGYILKSNFFQSISKMIYTQSRPLYKHAQICAEGCKEYNITHFFHIQCKHKFCTLINRQIKSLNEVEQEGFGLNRDKRS